MLLLPPLERGEQYHTQRHADQSVCFQKICYNSQDFCSTFPPLYNSPKSLWFSWSCWEQISPIFWYPRHPSLDYTSWHIHHGLSMTICWVCPPTTGAHSCQALKVGHKRPLGKTAQAADMLCLLGLDSYRNKLRGTVSCPRQVARAKPHSEGSFTDSLDIGFITPMRLLVVFQFFFPKC